MIIVIIISNAITEKEREGEGQREGERGRGEGGRGKKRGRESFRSVHENFAVRRAGKRRDLIPRRASGHARDDK